VAAVPTTRIQPAPNTATSTRARRPSSPESIVRRSTTTCASWIRATSGGVSARIERARASRHGRNERDPDRWNRIERHRSAAEDASVSTISSLEARASTPRHARATQRATFRACGRAVSVCARWDRDGGAAWVERREGRLSTRSARKSGSCAAADRGRRADDNSGLRPPSSLSPETPPRRPRRRSPRQPCARAVTRTPQIDQPPVRDLDHGTPTLRRARRARPARRRRRTADAKVRCVRVQDDAGVR